MDAATDYAGRPPSGDRRRPRRSGGRLALASIGALLVAVVLSGLLLFALDGKKLVTAGGSPIGRASPTAAVPPTAVGTAAGTPAASPTAGQAPTDVPTATSGPTDTPAPGGTPSPTDAATATPTATTAPPTIDVMPTSVSTCPSKPAAFTITYTAGPGATTWEADSPSPGDILLSLTQDGRGASADVTGTFQPGDAVTVYVDAQRLNFGPGQIPISAGGTSGIASVNYDDACGIVGPLARTVHPSE
jgi:hypothetical protein